jgi:hypothetical protein
MAYSWPHNIAGTSSGVQAIDIHVSYSTDGGKTWTYKGPLFTSQQVTNPVTGQTDDTANEVMNLFPQVVNGVTYWYGIHSLYNLPATGSGNSESQPYSRRWEIATAAGDADNGPMGLATAAPQYLGQSIDNESSFPVSTNLSSLDPEVSSCAEFPEPALVMENNNLYPFLDCVSSAGTDARGAALGKRAHLVERRHRRVAGERGQQRAVRPAQLDGLLRRLAGHQP